MGIVSKIDVLVRGNATDLERKLKDAEAKLAAFKSKVNSAGSSSGLQSMLAGGAGGAAFGAVTAIVEKVTSTIHSAASALAGFINESLGNLTERSHMAELIGMTTDQLAGLEHGAKMSAVPVEELHTALIKMGRSLSEAVQGKEVGEAFQRLGLDAEKLIAMPVDERMNALADAFKNVGTQSERIDLAMQIFGRSGARMASLLGQGSEGLKQFQDEADKLGLSVGEKGSAQVMAAHQAWTGFKETLSGIGNTLAVQVAPIITVVGQTLATLFGKRDILDNLNSTRDTILKFFIGLQIKVEELMNDTTRLGQHLVKVFSTIGDLLYDSVKRFTSWEELAKDPTGFKALIDGWKDTGKVMEQVANLQVEMEQAMKENSAQDFKRKIAERMYDLLNPDIKPLGGVGKPGAPPMEIPKLTVDKLELPKTPGADLFGSQDAWKVIAGQQTEKQEIAAQLKQQHDTLKAQLAEQKKMARHMEKAPLIGRAPV